MKKILCLIVILLISRIFAQAASPYPAMPVPNFNNSLIHQSGILNNRKFDNLKKYEFEKNALNKIIEDNKRTDNIRKKEFVEETKDEDIYLETKGNIPFHLNVMVDNSQRKSLGKWRGGIMLQDDNLLGFKDKLTVGMYANPNFITPFADYNIPVNKKGGRVGISYAYDISKINKNPYKRYKIKGQIHDYSLYFNQPIIKKDYMELESRSSIGYKLSKIGFMGNNVYKNKIAYAQTGLNFRYDTNRGIWYLEQNLSYAPSFFKHNSDYIKFEGGILRLHDFGHGFIGQIRGNYQIIPKNEVPYIEQITAGGGTSIRGYSEGLLYGRNAYLLSTELIFPILPRKILNKDKTKEIPFIGNYIKGFIFADHAGVFPYKKSGSYKQDNYLMSIGGGARIYLPKDINLTLAWGFPVMRNRNEDKNHHGRFHFDLNISPDFNVLLKDRKQKEKL